MHQREEPNKSYLSNTGNLIIWNVAVLFLVALDQATKYFAQTKLNFNEPVEIIPDVLNWRLLYNTGAAWSSFSEQTGLLTFASAAVCVGLIIYSFRTLKYSSKLKTFFLAFLLAGATGNLIDRFFYSKVTDFIDLLILPGNFPVFNLADVFINIAIVLLLADWLVAYRSPKEK